MGTALVRCVVIGSSGGGGGGFEVEAVVSAVTFSRKAV